MHRALSLSVGVMNRKANTARHGHRWPVAAIGSAAASCVSQDETSLSTAGKALESRGGGIPVEMLQATNFPAEKNASTQTVA